MLQACGLGSSQFCRGSPQRFPPMLGVLKAGNSKPETPGENSAEVGATGIGAIGPVD